MALITCYECNEQMSTSAKSCPKCGATPKKKKTKKGIILKFFIAIFLLLAAFIIYADFVPNTTSTNYSAADPVEAKSPEDIQGEEYLKKSLDGMNVENPETRHFYLDLASKFPGEFSVDQIANIYTYLRENWKYVNDPKGDEYFSPSNLTIQNNLTGDCDDFAILIASCIQGIGGTVRINFAFNEKSGHAYTEVKVGNGKNDAQQILKALNAHYNGIFDDIFGNNSVKRMNYREDSDGSIWLNLDWTGKYPGGKYFEYSKEWTVYPVDKQFTFETK